MGKKKRADFYVDLMGHDINNLNQVILANLELLQETNRFQPGQDAFLESAILATKDCARTVENVRALQAIAAGAVRLCDLDLGRVIKFSIRDAPRPAGKQVVIRYTPLQGPPGKGMIVKAMPELKLAIRNLIGNAVRFSAREVRIEIAESDTKTATCGSKCLVTAITDDGHGIPDLVKEKLFSGAGQDAAVLHGKRLGLYTAKALAEASGGWLEVADRVPGDHTQGTKVRIALPAGEGN